MFCMPDPWKTRFAALTARNVGDTIRVEFRGVTLVEPRVRVPIEGGCAQIRLSDRSKAFERALVDATDLPPFRGFSKER